MKSKSKTYKVVDLFAGAGGLSVGFDQAGFHSVWASDFDKDSCDTYKTNFPDTTVIHEDILKLTDDKILKLSKEGVDIVIGGPPCQGFSQLGKRLDNDPRNQLWRQFLRVVELLSPKVWIIENVPQLLKSAEFTAIQETAKRLGYHLEHKVLNAADYGVPQKRQRAVILATKKGILKHPKPTHGNPEHKNLLNGHLKPWKSVKDAFKGLTPKPNGINHHVGRNPTPLSIKRYESVPEGGNRFDLPEELQPDCWLNKPTGSTDVFGRLWWNKPALTIRTEFYKPEKGRYLHPSEDRPITLREGARIQTFPDEFTFTGSNVSIGRQIGNAVPCILAKNIALAVKKHLDENYQPLPPAHRGKHYTK